MGASVTTPCHEGHHGGHHRGCLTPPVMSPSEAKVSFFDNLLKNLTVAQVLRKNIWFSVPVPKIKFDPPIQRKII